MLSSFPLLKFIAFIAFIAVQAVLAAPPVASPDPNVVKSEALAAHNEYRFLHHAPDLKWNDKLAEKSKAVSDACVFEHKDMETPGQIIGYGSSSMKEFIDTAYSENRDYTYGQSPSYGSIGYAYQFTQIVWKATTEVGCAVTYCPNLQASNLYVCSYSPPGNLYGEYAANVLPP